MGFENSSALDGATAIPGWENWQALSLPDEDDDPSVTDLEKAEFTRQNDPAAYILRSRYKTADQSAVAPVQLVSALGHLYLFRQSQANANRVAPNTLLVDRFVLDGITNKLVRKFDVRYKRSKQRYKPFQQSQGSRLMQVDSLDFRDANGEFFYEPTIELSLVKNLQAGWFAVVLLPTNEHGKHRWHIFAHNSQTQQVEITSIRASADGLFDVKDETVLEPLVGDPNTLLPRSIPGIIRRGLEIKDSAGNPLSVARGISATRYDIQVERTTGNGQLQLLRENTRVMLAVPTDNGTTSTLSFAVALDGTLSQINETGSFSLLRNQSRDVLLPLNTLDEIKAIGDSTPPPQGTITGLERGEGDQVLVSATRTRPLRTGDLVQLDGTHHYDGHYTVTRIDDNTFAIDTTWLGSTVPNPTLGQWEVIPSEETGLIFDGMITGYELTNDGRLQVTVPNHGLDNGDSVQIEDTTSYDGIYPITTLGRNQFLIEHQWQAGEAVDLKMISRRRRGILFDGSEDWISVAAIPLRRPLVTLPFGQTYSAWIWLDSAGDHTQEIICETDGAVQFIVEGDKLSLKTAKSSEIHVVTETNPLPQRTWVHVAGVIAHDPTSGTITSALYRNGQEVAREQVSVDEIAANGNEPPLAFSTWTGAFDIGKHFVGKVAEVRIWDEARTSQTINDSMYLQLTGREVGLVGYWRLGAIAESKVFDFSVYGNDGTIHGDPFVSAAQLSRTLNDGTTQAIRYMNDELFCRNPACNLSGGLRVQG